jgi:hypothetical protein
MRRKIRLTAAFLILLSLCTTLVIGLWTAPYGYVWHLFHSQHVLFNGWSIPVPSDFLALDRGKGTLEVSRPQALFSPTWAPFAIVTFGQLPATTGPWLAEKNYEEMNTRVLAVENSAGFAFNALAKRPIGDETAYCWEFVNTKNAALNEVRCRLDKETLTIGYSGSQSYVEKFYAMLSATRAPKRP